MIIIIMQPMSKSSLSNFPISAFPPFPHTFYHFAFLSPYFCLLGWQNGYLKLFLIHSQITKNGFSIPSASNKLKTILNIVQQVKTTTKIQNSIANPINAPMQSRIIISISSSLRSFQRWKSIVARPITTLRLVIFFGKPPSAFF